MSGPSPTRPQPEHQSLYKYERLDQSKAQIRLFNLNLLSTPWIWDDTDNIQGTLETYHLDRDTPLQGYTALSYTWGPAEEVDVLEEEEKPHKILINGRKHMITKNLRDLLMELRRRELSLNKRKQILLWIDAVCIDQSNDLEKSWQVNLMSKIFHGAIRVIAWLGEGKDDELYRVRWMVNVVAQLVRKIGAEAGSSSRTSHWQSRVDVAEQFEACGLPPPYDARWGEFVHFIGRRWFSRIWIIQEALFSKETEYLCGSMTFNWQELRDTTDLFNWEIKKWRALPQDTTPPTQYGTPMSNMFQIRNFIIERRRLSHKYRTLIAGANENSQSPWTTLFELLIYTQTHRASDARDHVFALLGLVQLISKSDRPFMSAEYSKTAKEVFLEVTQGIISNESWLGVLALVEDRSYRVTEGLPSFVRDFSTPKNNPVPSHHYQETFRKATEPLFMSAPDPDIRFVGDTLELDGCIRLGTVSFVSEDLRTFHKSKSSFDLGASVIGSIPSKYPFTNQSRVEAAMESLLQGDDKISESDADLAWSFSCYCLYTTSYFRYLNGNQPWSVSDIDRDSLISLFDTEDKNNTISFAARLRNFINNRPTSSTIEDPRSADSISNDLYREGLPFENIFMSCYQDRRLFRSDANHLGTCHSSVMEGDVIFILPKSPCPLVLRRVGENRYTLVGWAYVHGFENGTVVESLGDRWENIVIE